MKWLLPEYVAALEATDPARHHDPLRRAGIPARARGLNAWSRIISSGGGMYQPDPEGDEEAFIR
jgi:hypothetical protein